MATVADPFDTSNSNNQDQPGQTGQGTNSAPTIGGQSAIANGGSSNSSSQPISSSGSFQNLSKYINANKGFNADNGGLAGTVSNNINNQAQQAQQNVQGAQNLFNTQAQQNVSGFNNTDAVNQAVQDPYAFTQNNPQGTQQVIAAENAQYTGPKGFEDLQGQQSLANLSIQNANVNDLANQTKTQSGQYNLLRQMFGTPSYTGGQQNLDQLIMNNAPGAQNQFAGARQQANDTSQALNTSQQQAQQQAQQNTQLANQVQASTRGELNNAVLNANTNINNEVTNAQTAQDKYTQDLQTALKSGHLTADQYQALGGDQSGLTSGMSMYNIDPTQYITNGLAPTAQGVATTADYNKIAALNQLMGGGAVANQDASQVLQQFNDPTQAGTFNPTAQFNSGAYLNSVQNQQRDYDQQATQLNALKQNALQLYSNEIANDEVHGGIGVSAGEQAIANAHYKLDMDTINSQLADLTKQSQGQQLYIDNSPTSNITKMMPRLGDVMKGTNGG